MCVSAFVCKRARGLTDSWVRLRICDNLVSETGGTLLADMLEKNGSLHYLDIRYVVCCTVPRQNNLLLLFRV